jgi:hypothetical protein
MANQPTDEKSPEKKSGECIHQGDIGRIHYRIYRNVHSLTGDYYRVSFRRPERKATGKEQRFKWFFHEDLEKVAKAALICHWWLVDNVGFVPGTVKNVFPKQLPVTDTKKSPVYEFLLGNVLGTIFENPGSNGKPYHKFYLRDADAPGESGVVRNSFGPEGMYHLAQATTHCRMWWEDRLAILGETKETPEEGEEKRPAKRKPRRAEK